MGNMNPPDHCLPPNAAAVEDDDGAGNALPLTYTLMGPPTYEAYATKYGLIKKQGKYAPRAFKELTELPYPIIARFEKLWPQMEAFSEALDWDYQHGLRPAFKACNYSLYPDYVEALRNGEYIHMTQRTTKVGGLLNAMYHVLDKNMVEYMHAVREKHIIDPVDIPALKTEIADIYFAITGKLVEANASIKR